MASAAPVPPFVALQTAINDLKSRPALNIGGFFNSADTLASTASCDTDRLSYLTAAGKEGFFKWITGDFTTKTNNDPRQGVYIASTVTAVTVGCFVRVNAEKFIYPEWFRLASDPDNTLSLQAAVDFGGRVVCSLRYYSLSQAIKIYKNDTWVEGTSDGIYGTIIYNSTTNCQHFIIHGSRSGVRRVSCEGTVRPTAGFAITIESGSYQCFVDARVQFAFNGVMNHGTESDITVIAEKLIGSYGWYYQGTSANKCYGTTINFFGSNTPSFNPINNVSQIKTYAASTAFSLYNVVNVNGLTWMCTAAGTTAASGGGPATPGGTSATDAFTVDVVDGTVKWRFLWNSSLTWGIQDSYAYTCRLTKHIALYGAYGLAMDDTANTGSSYPLWMNADHVELDHSFAANLDLRAGEGFQANKCWVGSCLTGNGIQSRSAFRGEIIISDPRVVGCAQNGMLFNGGGLINLGLVAVGGNSQSSPGMYHGIVFGAGISDFSIMGGSSGWTPTFTTATQGYSLVFINSNDNYQVTLRCRGNMATGVLGHTATSTRVINTIG